MAFELSLVVSCALGINWLVSGLILNLLQLITWLLVRPFSKNAYRSINYYLTYSNWSQLVFLAEWLSGSKLRLFYADEDSEKYFSREHTICVSNHKYEIDWLWCWLTMDKLGALANSKGMAKKSLRILPVMGWCWYFCEFIFLARDWEKDSLILGQCLDQFIEYVQPVVILLFCEGTRYTKEKYEASRDYAVQKGLPTLKHHLVPRSRGFVFSVRHLSKQNKLPAIYNIQVAFHEKHNQNPANFSTLLRGRPIVGDVYIERIPISRIDTSSDESINDFLFRMYQTKDNLMDYHQENGKFPGIQREHPRRLAPLINWTGWVTFSSASLILMCYVYIMTKSLTCLITIVVVLLMGVVVFYFLIRSTKAKRGSSYGTTPKTSPKHSTKSSKPTSNDADQNAATELKPNGSKKHD